MSDSGSLSFVMRVYLGVENFLLTHLVPQESVGPVFRLVFKAPLLFKDLGLGFLIPPNVMILTTVGRVTGNPHRTPVEYSYEPDRKAYLVMAGWEGRTDWYRNARAHPQLKV